MNPDGVALPVRMYTVCRKRRDRRGKEAHRKSIMPLLTRNATVCTGQRMYIKNHINFARHLLREEKCIFHHPRFDPTLTLELYCTYAKRY